MNVPESGFPGDMPWSGGELSYNLPIWEVVVIYRQLAMVAGYADQTANETNSGLKISRPWTESDGIQNRSKRSEVACGTDPGTESERHPWEDSAFLSGHSSPTDSSRR